MMVARYTTMGSRRGWCGHEHKCITAVVRCLLADREGCHAQGAYSDRYIVRTDGKPLNDDEVEVLAVELEDQSI